MSRYIDADELKKEVEYSMERNPHESGNLRSNHRVEHKHFMRLICSQPTADVVPVVHARWEYDPNGMDWNMGAWRCSKCKERNNNIGGDEKINPLLFAGSSYCPSCGAKMDESVKQ